MRSEPERNVALWDNQRYALKAFKDLGFEIGNTETPIIPLFIRDNTKTFTITHDLLCNGVFVTPVIAPAVPENDVLIRFALMATHTFEQVDEALDKITKAFKEAQIID
jgi:8-amino-7-oxononanoate synthase